MFVLEHSDDEEEEEEEGGEEVDPNAPVSITKSFDYYKK